MYTAAVCLKVRNRILKYLKKKCTLYFCTHYTFSMDRYEQI